MKVSARGIYSTGFLSLLRDLGYELTNLSEKQANRFNVYSRDKEDISIFDLKDKTGVVIFGNNVRGLIDKLKEILWDSLFFKKPIKRYKGKFIDLWEGDGIVFHTSEEKKREILKKIGNEIQGLNIIFKETCNDASIEDINRELSSLYGFSKYYINLGYQSKRILDEYRNKILPTLPNHHVYRKTLSDILDFSEILLEDVKADLLLKSVKKFIVKKLKERGYIRRYHRKVLTGLLLKYTEIIRDIKILEDNRIYLETLRLIKSDNGVYDGLQIKKEIGDYAITKYLEGEWYFVIEYYNKDNELKGKYININTPIEITMEILYNDLCIDVVEIGNERKIVDKEELDTSYKAGILSKRLYSKALDIATKLLNEGI